MADEEKGLAGLTGLVATSSRGSVEPVDLDIRDVSVSYASPHSPLDILSRISRSKPSSAERAAPKRVLNHVSARIPAGSLTAILGASGSGKTSLLNLISHRVPSSRLHVEGRVLYNGSASLRSVRSAYVMQTDVLLPDLTPRETLGYAARLRLPGAASAAACDAAVERVILELGLKECADTRVGGSAAKGCSGGGRRRTSGGVQLLANPSLLFLDEPTTGLDAHSAHQVARRLKGLAQAGRTVVMSLHSPRSEIWALFDHVVLLAHGSTLYSGPAPAALAHFAACGHRIARHVNPAEFLIDIASIDNRSLDLESKSTARVQRLKDAWTEKGMDHGGVRSSPTPSASPPRSDDQIKTDVDHHDHNKPGAEHQGRFAQRVSFARQLRTLTLRTIKVTLRNPMGLAASLFEATSLSIITGWIFLQLGRDLAGIRSREGSLYIAGAIQGYLILLFETYRLTYDIQLFDRERQEGVVQVSAFLFSRRLARFFLEDIPVPTIFSLIYYWMVGYRANASAFFIFYAVMIINQYIAVTLAAVAVAVARDFAGASLVANLSYTLQALACGFFVQVDQIPVYMRWLRWVAYNFYIFSALATNEFVGVDGGEYGQFYACPYSDNPADPACQQYVGVFIAESLGFPRDWIWRPIVIALSFVGLFFALAWLILRFKRVEIDVAAARKGQQEDADHSMKSSAPIPTDHQTHRVTVSLEDYGLEVHNRHLGKHTTRKTILQPITGAFEPGMLNVVMGPSGSGKTSLLQSIAQRLENSLGSRYHCTGKLLLNGATVPPGAMQSLVSFVTQDDDALMAELTVRETLRFAAGLRLPASMTSAEKNRRAEEVLWKMGLKDCADNVIGDELKKGISGGEKRRVSISIQILTDPKVLLLDEPTSGLDVFTANSVIEVLLALAAEGRTVVCTMHQSRKDVFEHFERIALLVRGGAPVYWGPGRDMLPHFARLGHECPDNTNPSDFVLDLVAVDLQEAGREAASRERVRRLVEAWSQGGSAAKDDAMPRAITLNDIPAELGALRRRMSPFRVTFPLVTRRSALQIFRNRDILLARTMQVISIGAIFALFFAPLQSNYEAVQSRVGYIAEFGALTFVGMLQNLSVFPAARRLFYREHADNCYSVATFALSYTLLELPFSAVTSLIFGVFAYAINLKRTAAFTFIAAFDAFAVVTCGESVGIIFNTLITQEGGFGVQVMSVVLSLGQIMGGVFSLNIPGFLQAWNHLSPIKYVTANAAVYGLSGETFTCTAAQQVDGVCPLATGEEVLQLYNLDKSGGANLAATAACVVVYRLVAILVLWAARTRWDWDTLFRRRKR